MKIILVSFLYEVELGGGATVVVNQLADALSSVGYEVVVLTSWKNRYVATEKINNIKVIRIPALNLYWVFNKETQPLYKKVLWQLIDIWNPWVYLLCKNIFNQERPDIVHVHKLRGLSPSVWSAAFDAGIKKIIHTCHDYELISPEGMLMGTIGRLAVTQNWLIRPYQMIRRHFSRLIFYAIAPSRYVLDMHRIMGFFSKSKVMVIPNTHGFSTQELDDIQFDAKRFRDSNGHVNFLYIGRLDKSKGVDVLCQAFLQVSKYYGSMSLTIAGWGSLAEGLRQEYSESKQIRFVGPAFGLKKAELFKNNDVLVCPSVAAEPFGIVVTEAYFYGLPVIASRLGAFTDIVKSGRTGYLVEAGSVQELSLVLKNFYEQPELIEEMSMNCYEEAEKYTIEKFINSYLEIYEANE